jgi:hypothetical protein
MATSFAEDYTMPVKHGIGRTFTQDYCCWALKRLKFAESDPSIQGYSEGVFWERNSLAHQKTQKVRNTGADDQMGLFDE